MMTLRSVLSYKTLYSPLKHARTLFSLHDLRVEEIRDRIKKNWIENNQIQKKIDAEIFIISNEEFDSLLLRQVHLFAKHNRLVIELNRAELEKMLSKTKN